MIDPIIARLTERRVELGMSQREVSRKSGVAVGAISEVERCDHQPTLTTLRAWSTALGLDITIEGGEL